MKYFGPPLVDFGGKPGTITGVSEEKKNEKRNAC
jgi:hypothetical protein